MNKKIGIIIRGSVTDLLPDIIREYNENFPSAEIILSTWEGQKIDNIKSTIHKLTTQKGYEVIKDSWQQTQAVEMTEEEIQVRLAENEAYHAENSLRSEFLFYQVYSSVDGGAWNLTGAAMTTEYVDDSAAAGQTIEYYVTALYDIGESDMSNTVQLDVVSVDEIGIPNTFALYQNYPNPFNPITSIRYDLPEAAHVRIAVYNVLGQKVATLVDQSMNAGFHDISWSGTNDLGSTVSSGVYLYRIESENFNAVRKLMYLK